MKNKRIINGVITLTFIAYIFTFFIMHYVMKDKEFSELENRLLEQKPEFSFASLFGGQYTKKFETYVDDQFPMRNEFISIKSYTQLAMQRKDNNGVYIGKEGYFLQDFKNPDMELLKKNISYINKFSEELNTYLMLAPTATKVYSELLPKYAQPYDEEAYISMVKNSLSSDVKFIDLLRTMEEKKGEDIYYKTDHHWTTLGAYYAYVEFIKNLGIEPIPIDEFNIEVASNEFYGSLFSKGNFTFAKGDKLDIYNWKEDNPLEVQYVAENKKFDSLYERSHLEKKDKYSVFLDNNHPLVVIKSSINNGKKLMVVKDSYANCLIPFLANHFEEIHVLDPRFLNMPISQYAKGNNIKDVLLLYNVQNFAKETSLVLLK